MHRHFGAKAWQPKTNNMSRSPVEVVRARRLDPPATSLESLPSKARTSGSSTRQKYTTEYPHLPAIKRPRNPWDSASCTDAFLCALPWHMHRKKSYSGRTCASLCLFHHPFYFAFAGRIVKKTLKKHSDSPNNKHIAPVVHVLKGCKKKYRRKACMCNCATTVHHCFSPLDVWNMWKSSFEDRGGPMWWLGSQIHKTIQFLRPLSDHAICWDGSFICLPSKCTV